MKNFKKVLGFALAIVMIGTQATTVFAGDPPTTSSGSGSILDYTVETVIVPTALKIALNPNEYTLTTGYDRIDADTAVESGTTYYVKSGSGYAKTVVTDDGTTRANDYYNPRTSSAQVISLNYGIANKSTEDKIVEVSVRASYEATNTSGTAITFVDAESKAQAYNSSTNTGGAKLGELKMYLEVASATAAPTAQTYKKTTDTEVNTGSPKYYTKSGSAYTKVTTSASVDKDVEELYEQDTVIGTEIEAIELADVSMTAATTGTATFVASGSTAAAAPTMAYSLAKGTYSLKDDEELTFDDTQDTLKNKLELSALGGTAGFTIKGKINPNADWTTATSQTKSITFTPIYKISDADGEEEAISGTHNQIETETENEETAYLSQDTITRNATAQLNMSLPDGVTFRSGTLTLSGTNYDMTSSQIYVSGGKLVIVAGNWGGGTVTVTFSDSHAEVITIS